MADKSDLETVSELTPLFYQAIENPDKWTLALGRMAAHICASSILLRASHKNTSKELLECCVPETGMQGFKNYCHDLLSGKMIKGEALFKPKRSCSQPEHCIQFFVTSYPAVFPEEPRLIPGFEGISYVYMYNIYFQDYDLVIKLIITRTQEQGAFKQEDWTRIELYMPSLLQSFRLLGIFNQSIKKQAILQRLIDNTNYGILVVNRKGYLQIANRAAVKMVSDCESIELTKSHHFAVKESHLKTRLKGYIDQVTSAGQDIKKGNKGSHHEFFVRVDKARSESSFLLIISPVNTYFDVKTAFDDLSEPLAIIHIIDTDGFGELESGRLQQALGISAAEADVLKHFAEGSSPKVIAQNKGRSYHTIRNHLQKIMNKNNIHRQADLIRLIYAIMVVQGGR